MNEKKDPNELLAEILTSINFSQFYRRYPVLAEVNGRRRSFLLQFAYPTLRVAVEVADPDNASKQRLCFDGDAYLSREMAIRDAGWNFVSFNDVDVVDYPEQVEFYVRHALGLGPKPNVLESKVVERIKGKPGATL